MVWPASYTNVPDVIDAVYDITTSTWSNGTPLDHALFSPWVAAHNALEVAIGLDADWASPSPTGNIRQRIAALQAGSWNVQISSVAPATPAVGDGWVDLTQSPPAFKVFAGGPGWVLVGAEAIALLGKALPAATLTGGQVLAYNSVTDQWEPASVVAGHTIEAGGAAVPTEPTLNFSNGLQASDDPGNLSTDVSLDPLELWVWGVD